jgi:hypothetical protein
MLCSRDGARSDLGWAQRIASGMPFGLGMHESEFDDEPDVP